MFNKFIERKRILQGMKEDNLIQHLKKLFPDLEKTNEFDSSDVYSRSKNSRAELKCRGEDYDDFLIEKLKWDKYKSVPKKECYILVVHTMVFGYLMLKISLNQNGKYRCTIKQLSLVITLRYLN